MEHRARAPAGRTAEVVKPRRSSRLRVVDGAASVVVPMTSQGILDFASSLHSTAVRMDREVGAFAGQSFLGTWETFLAARPWSDGPPPSGLKNLVAEIRAPLHVIGPTADYERLSRFNVRLQQLWDQGAKSHKWTEPRPLDTDPGKSTSPASSLESFGNMVIVLGLLWLLSRR